MKPYFIFIINYLTTKNINKKGRGTASIGVQKCHLVKKSGIFITAAEIPFL
jgi:hypothetical protein